MLKCRRIDICAMQETRWSGSKSKEIGSAYKIIEVQRYDDRLMRIMIAFDSVKIHSFSAYAPQSGLSNKVKNAFWTLLDEQTTAVPSEDFVTAGGDLNGHVGTEKNGNCAHGSSGVGDRNADGERVSEYADAHELVITNTLSCKRVTHLLTYYNGTTSSQIDYELVHRRDLKEVLDVKVLPYETVARQHCPLVRALRIEPPKQDSEESNGPNRIKWWCWKGNKHEIVGNIQLNLTPNVDST
ncbi:hypothetical protein ANCCEY_03314 [Ancylostoma ceylanicum]|nr:hypothetical protein ANCCEY_03314 [Ancylostoma ceylanicum]